MGGQWTTLRAEGRGRGGVGRRASEEEGEGRQSGEGQHCEFIDKSAHAPTTRPPEPSKPAQSASARKVRKHGVPDLSLVKGKTSRKSGKMVVRVWSRDTRTDKDGIG